MNTTDTAAVGGGLAVFGIVLLLVGFALYLLPAIIAFARHHRQAVAIFVLNPLLGWTFIGWIASLVWSLTNSQQVVYVQGVAGTQPIPVPTRPETPV